MSRFVRNSKYRHVYSNTPRKEYCYENAKVSGSAWDTDLIQASGRYLSLNWSVAGGGAFSILPLLSGAHAPLTISPAPQAFPTKLPDHLPLARGHSGPVLDTTWSPHNDEVVASCGEDGKVLVWKVDGSVFDGWGEEGWRSPGDFEPEGKLVGSGGRKVGQVVFNPSAEGILASASGDHIIRIWDIKREDAPKISLKGHNDTIQSIAWNYDGNLLVSTCRDKKLRIYDPRAGAEPIRVADGHQGLKGSRVVWLGDRDRLVTTGFSKMSDRQMILWETGGLTSLKTESIDSSSGVIMPFYAEGNDVLFLAGKGDGNIRYYEYENDELHYLSEYKSLDPQRGMGFLPRRALDVGSNEIARGFKVYGSAIEPLSFVVPRKAESFQSDLFPPAPSIEPALSADEYFSGKKAALRVVDLESGSISAAAISSSAPSPKAATPATSTPPPEKEVAKPAPAPVKEEPKMPSLRDMEIVQFDEDDDDEETDAKLRAPPGDFDEEPAKPVAQPERSESMKEKEVLQPEQPASAPEPVAAAVTTPAETKQASSSSTAPDTKENDALRAEVASLKRRLEQAESNNKKLSSQLEKAKSLGKELAGL